MKNLMKKDEWVVGMIVFGLATILALAVAGVGLLLGNSEITKNAWLLAGIGGFWTIVLAIPFVAEHLPFPF